MKKKKCNEKMDWEFWDEEEWKGEYILRFPEKYRENEKVLSESKKNIK